MNTMISDDRMLSVEQLTEVAGGQSALEDGYTFGNALGQMYWGARNYLSDTVYPYWLD